MSFFITSIQPDYLCSSPCAHVTEFWLMAFVQEWWAPLPIMAHRHLRLQYFCLHLTEWRETEKGRTTLWKTHEFLNDHTEGLLLTRNIYSGLCVKLTSVVSSYWDFRIFFIAAGVVYLHHYSPSLTWTLCGLGQCWPRCPLWHSLPLVSLIPYSIIFPFVYQWLSITFKKIKSKILSMSSLKCLVFYPSLSPS